MSVSHTIINLADTTNGCTQDVSNLVPDAIYTFEFDVTDLAGNEPTPVGRSNVTFDFMAPLLSEITPVTSPTNDTTPNYTFSSSEPGTITYSGSCTSATTEVEGLENGETITFDTLAEGTYENCNIEVTDAVGNMSQSLIPTSFTIDTTPPPIPETAPDLSLNSDTGISYFDNITNDNTPTFTGACPDGVTVNLYDEEDNLTGEYDCQANTYSVTSSPLSDGEHDGMSIRFEDTAGNISVAESPSITITIDTTAPTTSGAPDLTSDSGVSSADNITSGPNQVFAGSCTGGNTVQLFDDGVSSGSSDTCLNSEFSLTSGTLATGSNVITFKETDPAGNVSSASTPLSVTIDTTSPTISSVSSDKTNGSYTVGEVIDIDVTFSEAVQSSDNVTVTLETGATDRTCTFSVSSSTTGTCDYTVQAGDTTSDLTVSSISGTIRDIAGNSMSNFVPATNLAANKALVIDTTAPVSSSISVGSLTTTGATITWTTDTSASSSIAYGLTTSYGTVSTSTDSTSHSVILTGLTVGTTYHYNILARDTVGNISTSTDATFTTTAATTDSGGFSSTQTSTGGVITSTSNQTFTISLPTLNIASTTIQLTTATTTPTNINTVINATNPIFNTPTQQPTLNTQRQLFTNTNGTPFTFTKTLTTTSPQNNDIQKLQVFLNSTGYTIATTGPGSFGLETNKFGSATRAALLKFQKAVGIKGANGVFGPATRAYVNTIIQSALKGVGR